MIKKLITAIALGFFAMNFVGCTSSESTDDYEFTDEELSELDASEGSDVELGEEDFEGSSDTLPEEALADSDLNLDDDLAFDESTDTLEGNDFAAGDSSMDDELSLDDEFEAGDSLAATDPLQESDSLTDPTAFGDSTTTAENSSEIDNTPVPDTFMQSESTDTASSDTWDSSSSYVDDSFSQKPRSGGSPLQKVATTPWRNAGTLYNAVYYAKPGDTLSSISQQIYGTNRVTELKNGNGIFSSRGVVPGDKVYYNSPTRPMDDTRVLSYYEEKGMSPEIYVAKSGDTVKGVSKQLYGYTGAWKELWSSNSIETKGELAEGTQLRHFASAASMSSMAQMAPPPPAYEPPPMPQEMSAPEMPQDQQMAMNEMPPPPPVDDFSSTPPPPPMDAMNELPPPPPPMEMIPPPPPPPEAIANDMPSRGMEQMMDEEVPFYEDPAIALGIGAGALLLVGMIVISARRKRHQRELEQALSQQHVG